MKRFIKSLFFLLLLVGIERFCHFQTGGFRIGKVAQTIDGTSPLYSDLPDAWNQPYDFLGSGAQVYAFGSRDGRYVLKLFKSHHGWVASQKTLIKRAERFLRSACLAQTHLPNETGILALHFHPTVELGTLQIFDRLNIAHLIDLNKTLFVLQKRAEPTANRLDFLLKSGQIEEAKRSIRLLLDLTEETVEHGIKNKDVQLVRNSGFIDGKPLIIDIGSLSLRKQKCPATRLKVRQKAANQLRRYFSIYYPQYKEIVDE